MPPVVRPNKSGRVEGPAASLAPRTPVLPPEAAPPEPVQSEPEPQPQPDRPAFIESQTGLSAGLTKLLTPVAKELISNMIDSVVAALGLSDADVCSVLDEKLAEYTTE